jgi:uncharacterized membrane protein (UPF0127 family)
MRNPLHSWLAPPTAKVLVTRRGEPVSALRVELARNVWRRARGLMGRTELAEDAGMLFLYPWRRIVRIWMAGVPIPLDVLFIDEHDRVTSIVAKLPPHSVQAISSGVPVQRVLEVGAGQAERLGIEIGDAIRFRIDGRESALSGARGWRGAMRALTGKRS